MVQHLKIEFLIRYQIDWPCQLVQHLKIELPIQQRVNFGRGRQRSSLGNPCGISTYVLNREITMENNYGTQFSNALWENLFGMYFSEQWNSIFYFVTITTNNSLPSIFLSRTRPSHSFHYSSVILLWSHYILSRYDGCNSNVIKVW